MVRNVNQFAHTEVSFDIKMDFFKLKQPLLIYEMLGKRTLFFQNIKANRKRLVFEVCATELGKTLKQCKLCHSCHH